MICQYHFAHEAPHRPGRPAPPGRGRPHPARDPAPARAPATASARVTSPPAATLRSPRSATTSRCSARPAGCARSAARPMSTTGSARRPSSASGRSPASSRRRSARCRVADQSRSSDRRLQLVLGTYAVLVFAVLWVGLAVGLIAGGQAFADAWTWLNSLVPVARITAWILFLPIAIGLWAWNAGCRRRSSPPSSSASSPGRWSPSGAWPAPSDGAEERCAADEARGAELGCAGDEARGAA